MPVFSMSFRVCDTVNRNKELPKPIHLLERNCANLRSNKDYRTDLVSPVF